MIFDDERGFELGSDWYKCPFNKDPDICTCSTCFLHNEMKRGKAQLKTACDRNFGRDGTVFGVMKVPEPPPKEKETPRDKYERQRQERILEARQSQVGAVSNIPSYGNDPEFIKGYVEHTKNKDLSGPLSLTPQGQMLLGIASGLEGMDAALTELSETGSVVGAIGMAGRAALESYAERKLKLPKRPSWRQSETDVTSLLESKGFRTQVSFKDGVEVPYGTKGSTRPEAYKKGTSVEVKNYNVETAQGRNNLVRNVSNQAKHRAKNLPAATEQQVNIDVRGQNVSRAELNKVINRIVDKSDGVLKAENINILR